jgi:hypothetical protein
MYKKSNPSRQFGGFAHIAGGRHGQEPVFVGLRNIEPRNQAV